MGAEESMNFDHDFFDHYATIIYFKSRGASGTVYGPINRCGSKLAIKQVMFADGKVTQEFRKDLETKKDIWTSIEHKNLTKIHMVDFTRLPKVMHIVMEFAPGGSLCKTLKSLGSENKLPIAVVTNWAKQVADGMLYLHEKDIVHRDLKSANILLMKSFDSEHPHSKMTLKITDFDEVRKHDHTTTMSLVGTCSYMAPEVLKDQQFSKASDVWSFGVVIWEMLSGDIPHKGLQPKTMMSKSINGELHNLPIDLFPEDHKRLLSRCWESTYKERIPFHGISSMLQQMDEYKSEPYFIEMIITKESEEVKELITGLTILGKDLFAVSEKSSAIEVYDSTKLGFSRRLKLKELIDPKDIVSCCRNKCLYIFDFKDLRQSKEILRVDPNGNLINKWSTGDEWGYGLSVTDKSNVILTVQWKNKLNEYSPAGQLILEINLSADLGFPWHAIKLTNGHFVVSQGSIADDQHAVCIVDANGKLMKSLGGKRGSAIGQMNRPVHLSVDGNGFVYVVDRGNNRVLVLDSNLEFKRELLTKEKQGLRHAWRILLDESTGRALVAETKWDNGGHIIIYKI